MAITTTCSGCGKTLAVADQFAGRQARCPACNTIYTVPQPAPPTTPAKDIVAAADWGDPFDKRPIDLNPISQAEPLPPAVGQTPTDAAPVNSPSRPDLATTIGSSSESFDLPEMPEMIDQPQQPTQPTSTQPEQTPIELGPFTLGSVPPTLTPISSFDAQTGTSLYWMRAGDGSEYGPADNATLARWFHEGRVGPNYMIRQGEQGPWQPALRFAPTHAGVTGSQNPFSSPANVNSTPYVGYAKSDQSALVLAMGILAWVGFCPVFGLVAWAVGAQSLQDMLVGNADPTNRGLVQFGYYLGMINVIIWGCCIGFSFLSMTF